MISETDQYKYQQILLNNFLKEKLEQNKKEINKWTDYKNRHKKVIEGLEIFPLSVSEKCMIPIGKLAFMKGKLIHTNEILVCLGDGYFAKYSALQAIALCNRRISHTDQILKDLDREKNLYEMRQILPTEYDIFCEEYEKDIFEHWNEDKLDEWRTQHRQREKEYHQKLAESRKKAETDSECTEYTEEDLFKRLDELELQEELENEMCRLEDEQLKFYGDDLEEGEVYDESEDDDTSDSDQVTVEMLKEELKRLKDIQKNKVTSDTSNICSSPDATQDEISNINSTKNEESNHTVHSIQEESKESYPIESGNISDSTNIKQKRRVSFVEPCDQSNADDEAVIFPISYEDNTCGDKNDDCIRIEFLHSSYIPNKFESNDTRIQSPADIYETFRAPIKSILKRTPHDLLNNEVVPSLLGDSSTDTEDECFSIKPSAYGSVVKDIQERKATTSFNNTEEKKNTRTVSRFKMERVGNAK